MSSVQQEMVQVALQWRQLGLKSPAPSSSQITTTNIPVLTFYRPDVLPAAQPTLSKY